MRNGKVLVNKMKLLLRSFKDTIPRIPLKDKKVKINQSVAFNSPRW